MNRHCRTSVPSVSDARPLARTHAISSPPRFGTAACWRRSTSTDGSGSIRVASTRPAARSFQRLSTRCSSGIRKRRCASLFWWMYPAKTTFTQRIRSSGRVGGIREGGRSKNSSHRLWSSSFLRTGPNSVRRLSSQSSSTRSHTFHSASSRGKNITAMRASRVACGGRRIARPQEWRTRRTA